MVEKRGGGIFRAAVEAVKSLVRDHSEQDVLNAQRVIDGEITPEDRQAYRAREISRIISLATSIRQPPLIDGTDLAVLPSPFITMIQETEEFPNEKLDQRIRDQAAADLQRWKITRNLNV